MEQVLIYLFIIEDRIAEIKDYLKLIKTMIQAVVIFLVSENYLVLIVINGVNSSKDYRVEVLVKVAKNFGVFVELLRVLIIIVEEVL